MSNPGQGRSIAPHPLPRGAQHRSPTSTSSQSPSDGVSSTLPDAPPDGLNSNTLDGLPEGSDSNLPDTTRESSENSVLLRGTSERQEPTNRGASGRRRRVPDSITQNACTNCKRARAKCDGGKPVCTRCIQRQSRDTCHYELHVKTAKDQMIKEIQRLQGENSQLLERNASLDVEFSHAEQIIESLKEDGHGIEIIHRLKRGESVQSIAKWLGRPLRGAGVDMSPLAEQRIDATMQDYRTQMIQRNDPRFWTSAIRDPGLIEHLLQLYLTWIHPMHMLFDENHFLESLRNCADVYCSASLVNAMCAMACHLYHPRNVDSRAASVQINALRTRLLSEAKTMLKDVDNSKMTNIQSHSVISLAEIGAGLGLMAGTRLRLAAEALLAKNIHEQSEEAEKLSQWGVVTLLTAWSGFTYEKPSAPISPDAVVQLHQVTNETAWQCYQQEGDEQQEPTRRSFAIATASELSKLYRIIHQTILIYCGSRGKVTEHRLFQNYMRYRVLYESLPNSISISDDDDAALPHVLFFHIQYNTALIHLFQPLLGLPLLAPDYSLHARDVVKDLLTYHARSAFALLVEYQNKYSFHYISPLYLFCTVHICDCLVTYARPDDYIHDLPDPIRFCFAALEEAKLSYPIAGPLQKMFATALADSNITIPPDLMPTIRSLDSLCLDDMLNAVTRPSYRQPIGQLVPSMDKTLAWDFVKELERRGFVPRGRKGKERWDEVDGIGRVNVEDLLNP